ncbi:hypothetical protein B0H14DRAFT_2575135 [Mycena olivaceomarginata]|nr:hypothetical protein B0H14DRAFT_2575135 [Mycena olivaceomarginata]
MYCELGTNSLIDSGLIWILNQAPTPDMQCLRHRFTPSGLAPAKHGCIPEAAHANLNCLPSYYLTATPQCPHPDVWVGNTLSTVPFDAVYVQFYSGLNSYPSSGWKYATWNTWAIGAPNPRVKIFIGTLSRMPHRHMASHWSIQIYVVPDSAFSEQ